MTVPVSPRRSFLQYLADNNPFYLLSAACMLCACLLLSNTTTWSPIALQKLLGLIATLSVYELLLVGLGLFLIARRGHPRDGAMLLILEAFFLADVGFLASETYQHSLNAGLTVSLALMALAAVKLIAIFSVLKMPIRSPVFALTMLTTAALLFHPALFKLLSDDVGGYLPLRVMYLGWWGVGVLIAAYGVLTRVAPRLLFRGRVGGLRRVGMAHILIAVLLTSLIAHVATSHWVYKCLFVASDASPIFAGLAVLVASLPAAAVRRQQHVLTFSVLLVIASVLSAGDSQAMLDFKLANVTVTPLILALSFGYLALLYAFALQRFAELAAAGAIAVLVYRLSPTWQTIRDCTSNAYERIAELLDSLLPQSRAAWGGVTLFFAFALLAAGASLSLLHPRRRDGRASSESPSTLSGS